MPGLVNSIRRPNRYALGGLAVVISFDTFLPSGLNSATITRDGDGTITNIVVDAAAPIVRLEFEENEALFDDGTVITANKYPKHQLGMKFSGRDDAKNEVIKALDLTRTTHLAKMHDGQVVLLGGKNGLIAETSASGAGAKTDDFFGYDVLLSGGELEKAPLVPEAVFEALATGMDTLPGVPTITSFTPTSVVGGNNVVVTGTNLAFLTGATVGSASVSYAVLSSTTVRLTVPTGTASGVIALTTTSGSVTSSTSLTVTTAPVAATITSLNPGTGVTGNTVTVTGTGFVSVSAVTLNNAAVSGLNVVSATQLTFTVPSGATTGRVRVTTPGGTAVSPANFAVTTPATLAIPANRQAVPVSSTELLVTASAVTNATGYKLHRSDISGGTFTQIGGTLTTPSYNDTSRTTATTSYYKWQAIGGGAYADSAISAAFTGTTLGTGLTEYTPTDAQVWDNGTYNPPTQDGLTVRRNSYSLLPFTTEATQVEVLVYSDAFTEQPASVLKAAVTNGGTTATTTIAPTANAALQWKPIAGLGTGSKDITITNGFCQIFDEANVRGCYAVKIRANAEVRFTNQPAPQVREVLHGDSIMVVNQAEGAYPMLRRASNPSNTRLTIKAHGSAALAQVYKLTDDRAAYNAQVLGLFDGTVTNRYFFGLGVNDVARGTVPEFKERLTTLWDAIHAARPDVEFRPIVPQVRNDAAAADQIPYAAAFVEAILERSWIKLSYFQLLSIANLAGTDGIHPGVAGCQEMHDNMRVQEAYTGFRAPRAIDSNNQNEANFSGVGSWDKQTHPIFFDGTAWSTSNANAGIVITGKSYFRYIGVRYLTGPDSGDARIVLDGITVDTWSELDAPGTSYLLGTRWYDTGAYAEHAAGTDKYENVGTGVINYDGFLLR